MNDKLRIECKKTKAFQGITYKELAEKLGIKKNSFYSWLNGNFELSFDKQKTLFEILNSLSSGMKI